MAPMATLALAAAVFLVAHYVSSTPLRGGLVAMLGERAYLGLYTLASFAALGWMIWAYVKAPHEQLWAGDEFKAWAVVLMPLSIVSIVVGGMTKNPGAVRQEHALRELGEPRGILRITRHPIMWGIALWAAVHIIARGDAASAIFFGAMLLLAVSGTILIDLRKGRALAADWQRFAAVTSNVPFAAILQGRNRFRFDEIGWKRVSIGAAVYLVLMLAHPYVFGARPY